MSFYFVKPLGFWKQIMRKMKKYSDVKNSELNWQNISILRYSKNKLTLESSELLPFLYPTNY